MQTASWSGVVHRDAGGKSAADRCFLVRFAPVCLQAVNFLVSLLKKNWQNIKSLNIKSTMGQPQLLL